MISRSSQESKSIGTRTAEINGARADPVTRARLTAHVRTSSLRQHGSTAARGAGIFESTLGPAMAAFESITDGIVTLRSPALRDTATLIAGRDDEFHRWLGPGSDAPAPSACIAVGGDVVGWVDYDVDRAWLEPGEVNVGYNVFATHRGRGLASRAVQLLMHHLATAGEHHTATLLIHPDNARSLALARRTRFTRCGDLDGNPYFKRPVPPLAYHDGGVTLRRMRREDLDAHLASIDDAQIDWLWLPGQRVAWEAMRPAAQRAHVLRWIDESSRGFGRGPKWVFGVDAGRTRYVANVDCDLANVHVPPGDANIAYAAHPAHRGKGHVSRAVRLALRFLRDHTGAREAHLIVDGENDASRRVAQSVGAVERERWIDARGRTQVRHVCAV
jgi:RimJ/RimL family protein N-acetyltransferase